MTLEDRLEQLANRTPPSDPGEVMARARAQADSRPDARRPRLLAAAAVIAAIVLAAGALALTGGDENGSVTVAGPDGNPAQLQPSCDEITRFADSLDDTGIDYDYSASSSPQELASWSDAVFTGTLNETVSEVTDEESRLDYVGFEMQVTESFKSDGLPSGDTVTVLLPNGVQRSADYWANLVPPGSPVLVFAYVASESVPDAGSSMVVNGVEGIITACEDGPPLGLVGTGGDWPSFRTLADIEAALTDESGNRTDGQGGVDGPVMYAPSSDGAMEQALLSGVLARRGDCLYLDTPADPRPEPLLWPHGTTWDDNRTGVQLPDGTFVPVGSSFTASGGTRDIALRGHHPDVAERARACASEDVETVTYVQGEVNLTDSDPGQRGGISDEDAQNIVSNFLRLADEPSAAAAERLPFTEEVRLGLASELHQTRNRTQLADPSAWLIDEELFRAYTGPFSALDVVAGAESTVVTLGEHPHCASPPMPPPDEVADLHRVSVQPDLDENDSCLQWWTVDFFVNEIGHIEAVTLDLWEP